MCNQFGDACSQRIKSALTKMIHFFFQRQTQRNFLNLFPFIIFFFRTDFISLLKMMKNKTKSRVVVIYLSVIKSERVQKL